MQSKIFMLLCACLIVITAEAQKKSNTTSKPTTSYPEALYKNLEWRNIGPFRGGRSAAVTGVPGKPNLYYFGSTGGGVWRTTEAGTTWENISDGFFDALVGWVVESRVIPRPRSP